MFVRNKSIKSWINIILKTVFANTHYKNVLIFYAKKKAIQYYNNKITLIKESYIHICRYHLKINKILNKLF